MKQLKIQYEQAIYEAWIDKKTLAKALQISVSYINKLMHQRKIFAKKIGRSVRFKLSEVQTQLERGNSDE